MFHLIGRFNIQLSLYWGGLSCRCLVNMSPCLLVSFHFLFKVEALNWLVQVSQGAQIKRPGPKPRAQSLNNVNGNFPTKEKIDGNLKRNKL